ncbi:response regulator, partial [Magnetococcales bacterium HHB-1]
MELLQDEYYIKVARSGQKALQNAFADPMPDIILLDIMMPEMDGYEVCLKLKADPRTWSIPVLFITALNQQTNEERGLAVGAVDYITKPFQPSLVKARLRSQIELKRHKDRLEELVEERTRQLVETQDVTIMTLASLAEARDPETGGHIKRTQSYVGLLARTMA